MCLDKLAGCIERYKKMGLWFYNNGNDVYHEIVEQFMVIWNNSLKFDWNPSFWKKMAENNAELEDIQHNKAACDAAWNALFCIAV